MATIVKYATESGEAVGILRDGVVRTVLGIEAAPGEDPMIALIRQTPTRMPSVETAEGGMKLDALRLLPPITHPSKNVLCVGLNYHAHADEFISSGYDTPREPTGASTPSHPIVFTKAAASLNGPYDDVIAPWDLTQEVDYEAELGVVIGRRGRMIPEDQAYDHIWGYTVINDLTARDLQRQHAQWFLGKSIDTFCPMGPGIVTADSVDPEALQVRCWVNDELRQDASTRDLIFSIPKLVATISASVTLEPGDIIATGTPQGVGIGFAPPRFLKRGDRVRVEINGIGHIENCIS